MNLAKRFSYYFLVFALCAVMSLGSLSFMPKSFALGYSYNISLSEVLSHIPSSAASYFIYAYRDATSIYYVKIIYSDSGPLDIVSYNKNSWQYSANTTGILSYNELNGKWASFSPDTYRTVRYDRTGLSQFPISFDNCTISSTVSTRVNENGFDFEFDNGLISSIPIFRDYSPFFFPEMPHGYFDGNINVIDGSFNLDLNNITGTTSNTGDTTNLEHYSFVVPYYNVSANNSSSDFDFNDTTGIGHVQNSGYTSGNYTVTGQSTNTIHYVETGSVDINGSAPVSYTPSYNENSRFRCWSCVMDSSYVWFVSDTRNKITGSIVSVTSDEVIWKYEFSDPQGGNTIYPTWAIVFSPMGEVIQVLSPSTAANRNTYTLSCSIGTLEQDQDTGIWSCDPLYHGFWFSDDSPPVANITHLNVSENKKYLANPVFGESAFQLQFLDSINRGIADINSNIQSLQSAMQSSISGQTSAFQNMDAPSAAQPSTSQMMDYFSKESAFNAPNTDDVFSGDIKSGHYWDGVTWWSSKFNDIIVSNQVIVAFTTAMLTLGLAVLIIGRRFSMR